MPILTRLAWPRLVALLAGMACAGVWAAGHLRGVRDRDEVASMFDKKKTVCAGHFLIDAPAAAEVTLSNQIVEGFTIDTLEESEPAFLARVAARESRMKQHSAEIDGAGPVDMVSAEPLRVMGMVGRVLVYGHDSDRAQREAEPDAANRLLVEAHAHTGNVTFTVSAAFTNQERVRSAQSLLSRLRTRGREELPSEPGFCIDRAVILEPTTHHKTEQIALRLGFPGHPELAMAFVSTPGGGDLPRVIDNVAGRDVSTRLGEVVRITKLRKRMLNIDGFAGEEDLERVREVNLATTYGFNWFAEGSDDDPLQPFLSVQLQSGINPKLGGRPVDSSLQKDAVLALWDGILTSVRLRRTAVQASQLD